MAAASELERVVTELEPGGRLVRSHELTGGVSATVSGLEIATRAGAIRRVVFRQHRDGGFKGHASGVTATEYGVLAALHRAGLPVPEPYHLDDSGAVTDPYLIIEWVDGTTDVSADDLPSALDQMARFLVALHTLGPPTVPGLDAIEDPATAVLPFLPPTSIGDRIRTALSSGAPATENTRVALVHGDFWPGNVLWRHGRLAAVVDWEDAAIGDPLADVAGARVELLCRYGTGAMDEFTDRYLQLAAEASVSPSLDRLSVWEVYVSASALATMADWGLEPADEAHRRRLTQGFLERAAGELADR